MNDLKAPAAAYRSEVQRFAKILLFQQKQEATSHLLRLEEQVADGVGGATLTQEVQDGEEGQVLLGRLVVHK